MGGILLGIPIGLCVGFIFWGLSLMIDDCMPWQFRGVMNVVGAVVMAAIIIMSPFIGYVIEWNNNQKFIEQYKVVEETIENAIEDESLYGFERAELVNTALAYNNKLTSMQYSSQKWYGFAVPDEIMELEPMTFGSDTDG